MWISNAVARWVETISKSADSNATVLREALTSLREELASVRAERDSLKLQAAIDRTHFDWLANKVNALEQERAGLIERAYNIRLPAVPELTRITTPAAPLEEAFKLQDIFCDIGDDVAKKLGIPIHDQRD